MRFSPLALTLLILPLTACASVKDAVTAPKLAPMSYPAALVPTEPLSISYTARGPSSMPASANSLWRAGARTFFNDQRAGRVGDILTVLITIDDSTQTSNTTQSSRASTAKAGIGNFFGLESSLGKLFPQGFDPANAINTNSGLTNAGAGAVSRKEKISITVAAVVTQVLPNGNLVISGNQEVQTDNDIRHVGVDGIVRPEDITSANTINHTQIASARIEISGRGDQSRVQKTPAGQALIEKFSPF
jgi:flagellar L-ring protein precursor FlgH